MALIEIKTTKSIINGKEHWQPKRTMIIKCDYCGKIYEKEYIQAVVNRTYHFCSNKCVNESQKPNGILDTMKKEQCMETLGVLYPMSSETVRQKSTKTLMELYGVPFSSQSKEMREKTAATNIERYGGVSPASSPIVREKIKQTNLEKYGGVAPVCDPAIKAKVFKDIETMARRAHETRKKNGSYRKSNEENNFYNTYLLPRFGESDIERQLTFKGKRWSIDFHIKSIDLYIEYNGSYYHALDDDIEIIKNSSKPHDIARYKHYLRDQDKRKYFADRCMVLLVITDFDVKDGKVPALLDIYSNV